MDNMVLQKVWQQGQRLTVDDLSGCAFTGENAAHTFEISGKNASGAVAISGTIAGKFLRSDNVTVPVTGSSSDGVASITLTEDCYAVPGRFIFSVYANDGTHNICIYCGVGNVLRTDSGEYEGGEIITDVTALINAIKTAVATIPADYSTLLSAIAPTFSASTAYAAGSYVWYDGNLYKFTADHAAGSWTGTDAAAVALANDVADLKSIFNDFTEQVATETHSANIVDNGNIINVSIDGTGGYTFDTTNNGMRVPVTVGKRYGIFRINSSNAVIAYKPRIVICDSTGTVLRFINATDNDLTISETGASYILMGGSIALADWQKVMVIEDYEGTAPTSYIAKSTTYTITGIPDKTSDLVNDSGYVTETDISTVEKSTNVLNPASIVHAYIDGTGTLINDETSLAVVVDIVQNTRYGLFRNNSQGTVIEFSPRIRIEDAAGNLLAFYKNTTNDFTTPSNAAKMYIWNSGYTAETYATAQAVEGYNGTAPTSYSPYYKFLIINGKSQSWWKGKNAVIYGDSITAQGNANNATGYFREAEFIHQFENVYYRGVGGQTFKMNPYTFYANADGSYNSRDSGGNPPAGTTEHLGYFASWDRITAMIPDAIRKTIDLVVVCGGTNDFKNVEDTSADGDNSATVPEWVVNNTQDQQWASSSYYMNGDYNLSTLAGAVASTLMKMQIWCPNAIIILATPLPRYELTEHAQMIVNNVNFRQFCETEIDIAQYMSAPVIDANGECNITLYNYGDCTLADNVHPSQLGRDYYGKPFVGELYRVFPKSY